MKESRETTPTHIFFSLLLRGEEELETREGPVRSPFLSSHLRDKEGGPEKKSAVPVFSHMSLEVSRLGAPPLSSMNDSA